MKRKLVTGLFSLLIYLFGLSNDLSFKHLNVENGLSQSNVWAILKDRKGYMWFGTDYGLNKFDGYNFTYYVHENLDSNSISYDIITSIAEDNRGNLWIGTKFGLNKFNSDKEVFESFYYNMDNKNSLASNKIRIVFVDSKSRIWIGHSTGFDLYIPESNNFIRYSEQLKNGTLIGKSGIFSIEEDQEGNLWMGANGIFRLNEENNSLVKYSLDALFDNVVKIKQTGKGDLFAVSSNGLIYQYKKKSDSFEALLKGQNLINPYVNVVGEDREGNLVIGTDGNGIYILYGKDTSSLRNFSHDQDNLQSISNNYVNAIFNDSEGTLWLGFWRGGISYSSRFMKQMRHLGEVPDVINSLINNNVTYLYSGENELLWIGTSRGISILDKNSTIFENYSSRRLKSFPSDMINDIEEISENEIWIGTENSGIIVFDKKEKNFIPLYYPEKFLSKPFTIGAILKDSNENIWLGTSQGILVTNQEFSNTIHFSVSNSNLSSNKILTIFEDKNDNIWVGTNLGFSKFNQAKKDFDTFIIDKGSMNFFQQHINTFYEDSRNNFWICTYGWGLILFDRQTEEFLRFTQKTGLPSNMISGIIEDNSGKLWVSSIRGLSTLDIFTHRILRNYGLEDGLRGLEFNPRCCLKENDGELFFGGINGVTSFYPDSLPVNSIIPPVHITTVRIFDRSLKHKETKVIKGDVINSSAQVLFDYKQNSISIDFIALNFTSPEKNEYSFMLDGLETFWSIPGTARSASYYNLQPGTYTFKVKASNNDGLWSVSGASFSFKILPPWWLTQWAIIIYLLIIILILIAYAWFIRIREREKGLVYQAQMDKEHIKEVNRIQLDFFTNVSHEFQTPLSLILGPVEELQDYGRNNKFQKENIDLIAQNTNQLIHLFDDLLKFRKIENRLLELHPQKTELVSFIDKIIDRFKIEASKQNITLETLTGKKEIFCFCDQRKMEEIIQNLITNALKYSVSGGKITITTSLNTTGQSSMSGNLKSVPENVEIVVSDNGIGISEEDLPKIFSQFFLNRSNEDFCRKGTGLGLLLTKALVELHGGEIKVYSKFGEGTSFSIRFPVKRTLKAEEDITYKLDNGKDSTGLLYGEKDDSADTHGIQNEYSEKSPSELPLILVVEDHQDLREYIAKKLSRNYRIRQAQNGNEGWILTLSSFPDLVISDVIMPEMDGFALCSKIKNDLRTSHIPVILLTAKSELGNNIQGLNLGADAYITKPFHLKHLNVQIVSLIDMRRKLIKKFSQNNWLHPNEFTSNKVDDEFMKRTIAYIEANISQPDLNVENLGKELFISRRHLYRKITKMVGESPTDFIRNIRLKKSIQLLREGRLTISEVAYMTGFNTPSHFTSSFRKKYGQSPSKFLKT